MTRRLIAISLTALFVVTVLSLPALAQESPDPDGQLLAAAAAGDSIALVTALRRGADIDAQNEEGQTALMLAAGNNHQEVAKTLLDAGALTGLQDKSGRTASDIARAAGYDSVAKLIEGEKSEAAAPAMLDEQDAEPAAEAEQEPEPETAMDSKPSAETEQEPEAVSAQEDESRTMEEAAQAEPGASPSPPVNATEGSAHATLIGAARNGDADAVRRLLKEGADANASREEDRWTPLHWAVLHGSTPSVIVLLSSGANVNAKNRLAHLGIQWAVQRGYYDILKALLAAGSDPNTADEDGKNLLMEAATVAEDHPLIVKVLLDAGANPNVPDNDGRTVLTFAQRSGHFGVIETLEAAGAVSR